MRTVQSLSPRDLAAVACPWCGATPPRGERGLRALRDGHTLGVLVYGRADAERDLCAPGAWVVEQLWVDPREVGERIGTQLIQRACAELTGERARCLIAYGASGRPDCTHPPAGFLASAGFAEHVGGVQWRLDLRRTVPVWTRLRDAGAFGVRWWRTRPQAQPAGRVQT